MAINKNALIRYKTIDKCLQNKYKAWTLNDLINACSEALYEYEGREVSVSKRTTQSDIQLMRSDKLGYNAPIVVYDKKYYKYEDDNFTITDIPINETDMQVLTETVEMLKQFKDFSLFSEFGGIIQRLEDKVYSEKTHQAAIIHLDKNENLKGLKFLDEIYQAVIKKIVLKIDYKSFKARQANKIIIHPFILKEFNNRWFVVGENKNKVITLALDRVEIVDFALDIDYTSTKFVADEYYKNTIGVTVLDEKHTQTILLKIERSNAPYVITKPFHHSQKVEEKLSDGSVVISLRVHINYELERLILGFGDSIEVLAPRILRRNIKAQLLNASKYYE